jgi:hypothetical protein
MKQLAFRLVIVAVAVAAMSAIGQGFRGEGAPGQSNDKVDMTGKWAFQVQTDAGTGSPTFTIKQEGDQLTGHYVGTLGEADFTGTQTGKDFTITFSVDAQGMKLDVTYKGTVESKDAVKGTVSIAGFGDGTFTGKRQ